MLVWDMHGLQLRYTQLNVLHPGERVALMLHLPATPQINATAQRAANGVPNYNVVSRVGQCDGATWSHKAAALLCWSVHKACQRCSLPTRHGMHWLMVVPTARWACFHKRLAVPGLRHSLPQLTVIVSPLDTTFCSAARMACVTL